MTDAPPTGSSRNSRVINAPPEALYRAFTDPAALVVWLPPGEMTGEFQSFDLRVGGGYRMSLFYPASEQGARGKTVAGEDNVSVRFEELTPPTRIVEAVTFNSPDPALSGEMTMTITFATVSGGTNVTMVCEQIPPGIRPDENEAGGQSSLEKLARYIE